MAFANQDSDQALRNYLLLKRTYPIKYDAFDETNPRPYNNAVCHAKSETDFASTEERKKRRAARILFGSKKKAKGKSREGTGSSSNKRRKKRRNDEEGDEEKSPGHNRTAIPGALEVEAFDIPGADRGHIEVPEALFQPHANFAFVGPTRCGKTTTCTWLVKEYLRVKAFNQLRVISPTYESNPEFNVMFDYLKVPATERGDYICKDPAAAYGTLLAWISDYEELGKEWKKEKEYEKIHKRYKRKMDLSESELFVLGQRGFKAPNPEIVKPSMAIIIDDMTFTQLLSRHNQEYGQMLVRHRHLGGENIGVSFFTLVHDFKNGIPKCNRHNTHVFCLFPMADESVIESIWTETAGGCVSQEEFYRLYHEAIRNDDGDGQGKYRQSHNFLAVDVYNPELRKRFRRNFNEWLEPRLVDLDEEDALALAKAERKKSLLKAQT